MERRETDVLVIGGGLAGLIAALEAKKKGLDVTIVSKRKVARSGNTLVSNANISLLPQVDCNAEKSFYDDLIKSGRGLNDLELVKIFSKNAGNIVRILKNYGVKVVEKGGSLVLQHVPGHSTARTIHTDYSSINFFNRGLSITLPLLEQAKGQGIKIIEDAPVVKILVKDQQICGAVALNKETETAVIFHVPNIILASGGGGNIFRKTNNTRDITGDSFSLAYDAGAELKDMEFVQFYPTMLNCPVKMAMTNTLFGEGAVLINKDKQEFMSNYSPAGNMATRDVMARAIFTEIQEGRGVNGQVFMDCTSIPESTLVEKYQKQLSLLKKSGIDLTKDYLQVSPAVHFFMGGIAVNEKFETNVKGLYACGEATGGLHGANRLGGIALAEAIVFGRIAGENMVKKKVLSSLPHFEIESYRQGSVSSRELKDKIRSLMWQYCSLIREESSLREIKKEIVDMKKIVSDIKINNFKDLMDFYEFESMLNTSLLIIEAALLRKESRGAHFRIDYPQEYNSKFKGNFVIKQERQNQNIYFQSLK